MTRIRGIRYFNEAIAADPGYASAYAGLAFAYANLSSVYVPPIEAMPRAKAAALRAVELDPALAEGHAWLGQVSLFFDWDWEAARQALERALALNPSSVEARLGYANYLTSVGRIDEAIAETRAAQALDPASIVPYSSPLGSVWTLVMARRYDESVEDGERALAIDPAYSWTHAYMGIALSQSGDHDRALAALREARRLEDAPMLKAFLAYGYARAGRRGEAEALLDDVAEVSRTQYTCAYEIAVAYAALGERDEAFAWLDKALADRADCVPYMNVDPRLDALRGDPRFEQLLDRAGFARAGPARGATLRRRPHSVFAIPAPKRVFVNEPR